MTRLFLLLGLVGFLASCNTVDSDEVKPEEIYQSYMYEFDAQLNKTKAHAAFQIGSNTGKYIQLTEPASIRVNEKDYDEYNNFGMYHYHFRFNSKQDATFVFTDNDGKSFSNTIEKESLNGIGFEGEISYEKGMDLFINFSGLPVQDRESVYVYLWNELTNATHYQTTKGETSITIPASKLRDFDGSMVNITLHREIKYSLENTTTAGGELEFLFSSAKKQIQM